MERCRIHRSLHGTHGCRTYAHDVLCMERKNTVKSWLLKLYRCASVIEEKTLICPRWEYDPIISHLWLHFLIVSTFNRGIRNINEFLGGVLMTVITQFPPQLNSYCNQWPVRKSHHWKGTLWWSCRPEELVPKWGGQW